jgi:hypothetical protein
MYKRQQKIVMTIRCMLKKDRNIKFDIVIPDKTNLVEFVTMAFDRMPFNHIQDLLGMHCETTTIENGKRLQKWISINFSPTDLLDINSVVWLNLKNTYLTMRRIEKEIKDYEKLIDF